MNESITGVTKLGSSTKYQYDNPDISILEKFEWKGSKNISIFLHCNEFSSLCPITGQPDWATINIWYTPDKWCVESKSLKLYLGAFRQHGAFHESVINLIGNHLIEALQPSKLKIHGDFHSRGGISINPTFEYSK